MAVRFLFRMIETFRIDCSDGCIAVNGPKTLNFVV